MAKAKSIEMVYAGFSPRLGALLIDILVFLPLGLINLWLYRTSWAYAIGAPIPYLLLVTFYTVYFHARWGQTLGKMAVGIKVVAVDGSPISFRRALLRSSVDFILGILTSLVSINTLLCISATEYATLEARERSQRFAELSKSWRWLDWLDETWMWSEIVVILFNKKRRALHDFIAGTVVIHVQNSRQPS